MKKIDTNHTITLPSDMTLPVTSEVIAGWIDTVLECENRNTQSVDVIFVGRDTSQNLNNKFRGKNKPTNVLSFHNDDAEHSLLGELFICRSIVEEEALNENKSETAHLAHLTIHGVLHLLGYNHVCDDEAKEMEAREISILRKMDFANPYEEPKSQ